MPPRLNTRYQYMRAFYNSDREEWDLEIPDAFRFERQDDNTPYVVTSGDTLQAIAYRFYRNMEDPAQLWRAIAEFNDIIDASEILEVGRLLVIPSERWINEVFLAPTPEFNRITEQYGNAS